MRTAFHIAVVALLAYLVADRAMLRMQPHAPNTMTCAQGAEALRLGALVKGLPQAAASSQSEAFLSTCLVTGSQRLGDMVVRE
jgi:hypothetical protein